MNMIDAEEHQGNGKIIPVEPKKEPIYRIDPGYSD